MLWTNTGVFCHGNRRMCRAFSTRRTIAGGADPWWRVVRGDNDVGDTGNSMAFVGDGHGGRDSDVDQFRDA